MTRATPLPRLNRLIAALAQAFRFSRRREELSLSETDLNLLSEISEIAPVRTVTDFRQTNFTRPATHVQLVSCTGVYNLQGHDFDRLITEGALTTSAQITPAAKAVLRKFGM